MKPRVGPAVSDRRGADMRRALLLLALLSASAHAELPVPPESRWNTLPRLAMKPGFKASTNWIKKAQALQDTGKCAFAGKRPGWTQIELPFAVLLSVRGQVQVVKVGGAGCPELETYVAGVVRKFSAKQIVPPRGTPPYWRGSRFVAGWQD
jgi:hypothetical protein